MNKIPFNSLGDALDKIIYDLLPDHENYCDRIRMQQKRRRDDIRANILKTVKDLEDANSSKGEGQVSATR